MTEKRTRLVLEAQARGFEQAGREARKVTDAIKVPKDAEKNFTALDKAVGRSAHAFARVGKAVADLNKLIKAQDGVAMMAKMRSEVDRVAAAVEKLNDKKRRGYQDEEERERRRDRAMSFQRGVAQGMGVGEYFPERTAPGFYRNLAGRAVGRGLGVAGQFASSPFTGAQGIMTGLSGIPLVGGALAGQLQAGMGAAQQAAAVHQARHAMSPFMSLTGGPSERRIAQARSRAAAGVNVPEVSGAVARNEGEMARARALTKVPEGDRALPPSAMNLAAAAAVKAMKALGLGAVQDTSGGLQREFEGETAAEQARSRSLRQQRGARSAAKKRRAAAADAAEDKVRNEPFGDLRKMALDFGLDETGGLEVAGGFLGASGGTLDRTLRSAGGTRAMRAAMGAQSKFGIGGAVSGTFARGTETGAFGRAGVDPTDALSSAVRDGLRLGLSGSDLEGFVQDMAERLRSFETTGLPLARDSLVGLQLGLAGALGTNRAAAVAGGITGRAQAMSLQGPQSAADFLMLREMGGFTGGGLDQYYDALVRMQSGGSPEGFQNLIKGVQTTGSSKGNALAVQNLLRRFNVSATPEEAMRMTGTGDAALMEQFRQRSVRGEREAEAFDASSLDALGQRATPSSKRALAGLTNEQVAAGEKLMRTMIDLESTSAQLLTNFSELSRHTESLAAFARDGSKNLREIYRDTADLLQQAKQLMAR